MKIYCQLYLKNNLLPQNICLNKTADKDENPELPGSDWDYTFSEQNGKTKVSITIYDESHARMEKMIEMGFTEGFKVSMNNLENLLASLTQK